jgi:5'-3' exonuclease
MGARPYEINAKKSGETGHSIFRRLPGGRPFAWTARLPGPPFSSTMQRMDVHLVDGTYELFRYFYSPGEKKRSAGAPGEALRGARGVVASMIGMLESGATHVGVATDHVVESFRNELWPGYKTGEGIDPELFAQFVPLEEALASLGVTVWAMVEFEADDALGAAAIVAERDPRVERVFVCSPDKDLAQCVRGDRVVQLDRRKDEVRDADGVVAKFGVPPESIPDWLGLVGDAADGFPGIPGWGAKSAATVLARYLKIEAIPERAADWDVTVRGAERLSASLAEQREAALLFRRIATLRDDVPVGTVDDWGWNGPREDFAETAARLGEPRLAERAKALAAQRA